MKKTILTLATAGLFACASLLSFSTNSSGHLTFFKNAQALQDKDYYLYWGTCTIYPFKTISTCGVGSANCTPEGTCY